MALTDATDVKKGEYLCPNGRGLGLYKANSCIDGFKWKCSQMTSKPKKKPMKLGRREKERFLQVVFDGMICQAKQLGGYWSILEIDESKFGRRKHYRGHRVEGENEDENDDH
ncbi:unnamed protein product, partial [Didymodactylos carnosus]